MKRTIFIWDVHGCYDELMALCARVEITEDDHLYFVWDLINKWPKSLEVVEFVRHRPNTWSVIGNHEYFLLTDMDDLNPIMVTDEIRRWRFSSSFAHVDELRLILSPHREWLLSLPHIIEREDFIVIHGGIHPEYGLDTPLEIATLIRNVDGKQWYLSYAGEKPVFYGHWATEWLRIRTNTIGLDTGCCFGWALTAYCLESREVWQVRANRVHKEPNHWKTIQS